MKTYKIGLIGFGYIGKIHANAYHNIPFCFEKPAADGKVTTILRNSPKQDRELIDSLAIPLCTDQKELFWDQDFDMVDICSPNASHYEYCLNAIDKNIPIYCEKPLTNEIEDARSLAKMVKHHNISTHTAFVYRTLPSVILAKEIIQNGLLGEINHFEAKLFHSSYLDPNRPISWRLQSSTAGGGALTDLGIHLLDLCRYLLGETDWIQCQTKTFIKTRPTTRDPNTFLEVNVDDWALSTLGLNSGGIGTIEVSRVAGGAGDVNMMEIFGSRGSLKLDFYKSGIPQFYDAKKGAWISGYKLLDGIQSTSDPTINWPTPKHSLGMFMDSHIASIMYFLRCLEEKTPSIANFESSLKSQELLHAAYQSAALNGKKVTINT